MRTILMLVALVPGTAWAQAKAPAAGLQTACTLTGVVQSGAYLLPGVAITITSPEVTGTASTSTGSEGAYSVTLPGPGDRKSVV
jgi:hypothetical protein